MTAAADCTDGDGLRLASPLRNEDWLQVRQTELLVQYAVAMLHGSRSVAEVEGVRHISMSAIAGG